MIEISRKIADLVNVWNFIIEAIIIDKTEFLVKLFSFKESFIIENTFKGKNGMVVYIYKSNYSDNKYLI